MPTRNVVLRVASKNPEWKSVCCGEETAGFLHGYGLVLEGTTYKDLVRYLSKNGRRVRAIIFAGGGDEYKQIDQALWALNRAYPRETIARLVITSDLIVAQCVADERGAKVLLHTFNKSDAKKLGYSYYPDETTLLEALGVKLTAAQRRALLERAERRSALPTSRTSRGGRVRGD